MAVDQSKPIEGEVEAPKRNGKRGVAKVVPIAAPASTEGDALLALIARNPTASIEWIERIVALRNAEIARVAKTAYLTALADLQAEMPTIDKLGVIGMNEKNDQGQKTGKQKAMAKYAKWEDVVEGITPWLYKHGFSLSFRIDQPTPERISVTAVLGHRSGHSEQTSIGLPFDSSGAKNNPQGWGSSVSYGKRYTAFALLNISARGEDDDGKAAGAGAKVGAEDVEKLRSLIMETQSDVAAFYNLFGIECLEDLPQGKLDTALRMLELKKNKRK